MNPAVCVALLISIAATGCSSWRQVVYYSGQQWQRNECNKIADQNERQQCMKRTDMSFGEYRRQTEDGTKWIRQHPAPLVQAGSASAIAAAEATRRRLAARGLLLAYCAFAGKFIEGFRMRKYLITSIAMGLLLWKS